jgi:tetrahydromethanopterin S-methyltransferase subunit G
MWDTIKSLDDQVGTLQVSVAGEYLKREEWKDDMRRLMEKLDSIDEKLDKKADK